MPEEFEWCIYYADGSTRSNKDKNTPIVGRGVQAIVQKHSQVGWHVVNGGDYYIQTDFGGWVAVDRFGLYDYLLDTGLVLFGRTISTEEYQKIFQQALSDADMGRKGGFAIDERRP